MSDEIMQRRQLTQKQSSLAAPRSAREAQLSLAQDVFAYEQLKQDAGAKLREDFVGLALLDKYGKARLEQSGRRIIDDLQGGGFDRLKAAGLIKSDQMPENRGENQTQSLITALKDLKSLSYGKGGDLDLSLRRDAAMAVVDFDPAMTRTNQIARSLGQDVATFAKLFQAGMNGTKGSHFVASVKETAASIESIVQKVDAADVQAMRDIADQLKTAAADAQDPETQRELQARYDSVSGILDFVDPESANHKSLMETIRVAKSREFNEDNVDNWLKENGPTIVAFAAAVSLTIAYAPVGASALSIVLASSGKALLATQATKDILHLINNSVGDTGLGNLNERSYFGDWYVKNLDTLGQVVTADSALTSDAAKDMVTSLVTDVTGPLGVEYARNVVYGLLGLGALRVGQAGMKGLSPQWVKSVAANPQSMKMITEMSESIGSASTNPAAAAFAKQWLAHLSKEAGQELCEEGAQNIGERVLTQGGVNPTAATVLMSVAFGAGQGKLHGKIGNVNQDGSVSMHADVTAQTLDKLKAAGQKVEKLSDTSYKVSSYDNPNQSMIVNFTSDIPTLLDASKTLQTESLPGHSIVEQKNGQWSVVGKGGKIFSADAAGRITLEDGSVLTKTGSVMERLKPGGTIEVTSFDPYSDKSQTIQLRADRTFVDADGTIKQYLTQAEMSAEYKTIEERSGDLTSRKADYTVQLNQIMSAEHPQGVRLSTKENRLKVGSYDSQQQKWIGDDLHLVTATGATITLPPGTQLPKGVQIDPASQQLIVPSTGILLPGGERIMSQKVATSSINDGQNLNPGNETEPGDWAILRRTTDDFGNEVYDAYHQSNTTKNKKWDLAEGSTYKAKTDADKKMVLLEGKNIIFVPSYGGFASNDGTSTIVKDVDSKGATKGHYFIGIEELKQTHVGDEQSQARIDAAWAQARAQRIGGFYDPSLPSMYFTEQQGRLRAIKADGNVVDADASNRILLPDGSTMGLAGQNLERIGQNGNTIAVQYGGRVTPDAELNVDTNPADASGLPERSGSDREKYADAMNSTLRLKYAQILPWIREDASSIVDVGCGTGELIKQLSRNFTDAKFTGLEIQEDMRSLARKTNEGNANVEIADVNLSNQPLPDGQDAVILSSVAHEFYSYNQDGDQVVKDVLGKIHDSLVPGGRIIIRDPVSPSLKEDVWMHLPKEQTQEFFKRFATEFRPDSDTPPIGFETHVDEDGKTWIKTSAHDANEFMLHNNYRDSWDAERKEQYGTYDLETWQNALRDAGFKVVEAREISNPWISNNQFWPEVDLRLNDGGKPGDKLPFFATNMVLVGEVDAEAAPQGMNAPRAMTTIEAISGESMSGKQLWEQLNGVDLQKVRSRIDTVRSMVNGASTDGERARHSVSLQRLTRLQKLKESFNNYDLRGLGWEFCSRLSSL